ncbi:hypothetical protein OESDEN_23868 [Oesophagostomum dentatum]|uniref:Uncharacterized protein n=1 Tax=Oesophagostomum dentatum TaxID=61180 RepID=A0A0B1RZ60_OESDE|nr:hypothetical protein OESDEN_23868 [Oesophagostomum dentatum]
MGAEELALKCSGARVIAPRPGVELNIDLDELDQDKVEALFDNLEEAQMCIRAIDTDHVEYNFEKLNKLRPCAPGKPVLDIRNNKNLFRLSFNKKLEIASPAIIRGNPSLNPHFIGRLLKLKEIAWDVTSRRAKVCPFYIRIWNSLFTLKRRTVTS